MQACAIHLERLELLLEKSSATGSLEWIIHLFSHADRSFHTLHCLEPKALAHSCRSTEKSTRNSHQRLPVPRSLFFPLLCYRLHDPNCPCLLFPLNFPFPLPWILFGWQKCCGNTGQNEALCQGPYVPHGFVMSWPQLVCMLSNICKMVTVILLSLVP